MRVFVKLIPLFALLAVVSVNAQEGAGNALRFDGAADNVTAPTPTR
jgi:hypothetical protein